MASIAIAESAAARQSMEESTGRSGPMPCQSTLTTCRKTTWMANHKARFRITPTTAAVIADRAAYSAQVGASHLRHEPHTGQGSRIGPVLTMSIFYTNMSVEKIDTEFCYAALD